MLTHLAYTNDIHCSKKETHIFCLTSHMERCMALYFNTTKADPMQHAPHSSSPTKTSTVLPWPSLSPELNPNKHAWNESERRFRDRVNAPANVRELFQTLKQQWVPIPAQVIYNLIQSMPGRCWAVFDSRGGLPPTFLCVSLSRKTPSD